MLLAMTQGAKMPKKSLWGSIIETPEDKAARKAIQFKMPRDSFHQKPCITYPRSPSEWRTHTPEPHLIQPRIVEQPDAASLEKQCIYRKKLEKEKSKTRKKKSDFLLSKFVQSSPTKQKETYMWEEKLKPERLKILIKYLSSPVELEQLYAAQALGKLGFAEESVLSALRNALQECNSLPLQYEVARSLALLGCLETSVMKVLIRHLKVVSLNRREDTLAALKVALQAWSRMPTFEGYCIGARSSLIRNLQRLVDLQQPEDDTSFSAALCLGYLDKSSRIAQVVMFMSLTQNDWQKKDQALVMLVKQMGIMDAVVIRRILDQLQRSPMYEHRVDAAKLLATIGLETIQQEGMEEDVFNMLLMKLSNEPLLVVRQSVVLAVEELRMKKRVWDIVEKQLKDDRDEIRKQAVIALGVLGIRHKGVFFALLEMLELDSSEDVRVQVIRAFSSLGMNNVYVRKSLRNKEQMEGILARESARALKILDKIADAQKALRLQSYRVH
ncbi:protein HEATR9 [Varanus komodoensis]|uniref:protein HEATR9 n=1 Tax=Varanus komodoensis TaxID=61221 RepID=UPI001CF7CF84|nr:protein HEATR9 [Varanus komodoensis]